MLRPGSIYLSTTQPPIRPTSCPINPTVSRYQAPTKLPNLQHSQPNTQSLKQPSLTKLVSTTASPSITLVDDDSNGWNKNSIMTIAFGIGGTLLGITGAVVAIHKGIRWGKKS